MNCANSISDERLLPEGTLEIWLLSSSKNLAERSPLKYTSVNHCLDTEKLGGCFCHLFHCKEES